MKRTTVLSGLIVALGVGGAAYWSVASSDSRQTEETPPGDGSSRGSANTLLQAHPAPARFRDIEAAERDVLEAYARIFEQLPEGKECDGIARHLRREIERAAPAFQRLASLREALSPEERQKAVRKFQKRNARDIGALQTHISEVIRDCSRNEDMKQALRALAALSPS